MVSQQVLHVHCERKHMHMQTDYASPEKCENKTFILVLLLYNAEGDTNTFGLVWPVQQS